MSGWFWSSPLDAGGALAVAGVSVGLLQGLLGPLSDGTQAVVPVLIGPLQTFLAILPGLLAGLGAGLVALFKPSGMKKLVLFFWHQKVFTCCLIAVAGGVIYGSANNWWRSGQAAQAAIGGYDWVAFRGGPARTGAVPESPEPVTNDAIWSVKPKVAGRVTSIEFKTFYASSAVVGNRVYISSAEKGPLTDRGAILAVDASSGAVAWSYSPKDFRATFSSPSVVYKRDSAGQPVKKDGQYQGYVVCGEGLHFTTNARVTCLDLAGNRLWEYRTASHVESSPCIADGRVYIGAGDDGYYCFELEPKGGKPAIVWHVGGKGSADHERYRDCETAPVVADGVCYVGLGEGGQAIVALDARTGKELWRIAAPYPVFSSPTLGHRLRTEGGKTTAERLLFVGMGTGNFIETAEQIRARKLQEMKEAGRSEAELAEAAKKLAPVGEVWCINLNSYKPGSPPRVEWQFKISQTVLGGIAHVPPAGASQGDGVAEGLVYFGSRDGMFYCVSTAGQKVGKPFAAGAPIVTSPAVGRDHLYFATESGVLYGLTAGDLKPVWQATLAGGAMSSPALANGHVFIGTNEDGLRCIGRVKPVTPVWANGATGGQSDRTPVPALARFSARYPGESDTDFRVTGPLMPLAGPAATQPESGSTRLARYIYAPVSRGGRSELLKFQHGTLGRKDADPVIWSASFDRPIRLPPAGVGDELFVVEGEPGQGLTMQVVDARTGQRGDWRLELPAGTPGQFAIDGRRMFIWTGPQRLSCLDVHEGRREIWSAENIGSGVVAPLAADGLVTVATGSALVTLEAATGRELWRNRSPGLPLFAPARMGGRFVLATERGVFGCSLGDGSVLWSAPEVGRVARAPLADSEKVVAVSESGRLFVLDAATGGLLRVKDTSRRGGGAVIRPLAPAERVDTRVMPMMLDDRIIFAQFKAGSADGSGQSDLMVLTLPDRASGEAGAAPTTQPEFAVVELARWSATGFMGPILTPLAIVEGQAYLATEKLGLVCLK